MDDMIDDPQIPLDLPIQRENVSQTLKELTLHYPDEVISALLKETWWPKHLELLTGYSRMRFEDDSVLGTIGVIMSHDGDAWIEIVSTPDPNEFGRSLRFRTFLGGGQSPSVRNALLILAEAIRLDNKEHPQHRQRL